MILQNRQTREIPYAFNANKNQEQRNNKTWKEIKCSLGVKSEANMH